MHAEEMIDTALDRSVVLGYANIGLEVRKRLPGWPAAPSRVINVTSGGQYGQKVPDGDLQSEHTSYGPKKVYARTKREQVVITREWARRLAGDAIYVHAMHPGWADTKGVREWMPAFRAVTRPFIRTPGQGADTIVWLGSAPEAIQSTGQLWQDRRSRPLTYRLGAGPDDDATAGRLWDYVAGLGLQRPAVG